MGIELSAVDDEGIVGWLAGATRVGELDMKNVAQVVGAITGYMRTYVPPPNPQDLTIYAQSHGRVPMPVTPAPGASRLSRLNFLDHGNSDGGEFGSDWVTVSTFPSFQVEFRKLRPWFAQDGFVHLQHCEIGQNVGLLQLFADTFGVPVVGGRGYHNPLYRANYGYYARVQPAAADGSRPAPEIFFWRP